MDLEIKISNWKKQLYKHRHLEEGMIAELETHLRDSIDRNMELGMSAKEAFDRACDDLGDLSELEQQEELVLRKTAPRWMPDLIRNFITANRRYFFKHKLYNLINLSGLIVGFTAMLFIGLFVYDELTYESMHPDYQDIYRLSYVRTMEDGSLEKRAYSSGAWSVRMRDEFPGVTEQFRFVNLSYGYLHDPVNNRSFYEEGIYWSDPNFFEFLKMPIKSGSEEGPLLDKRSLMLTERTSQKIFGNENPIGKRLDYVRRGRRFPLTVTGIIYDPPKNTHFQPDYVALIDQADELYGMQYKGWATEWVRPMNIYSYLKIEDPVLIPEIEHRLKTWWEEELGEAGERMTPLITPLTDIHFNPPIKWELDNPIDMSYLYGLLIIGGFVLLIITTNFVNLSAVQISKRQKEIGLRKTLGSSSGQLRLQFLIESLSTVLLAYLVAVLLVYVFLSEFNILIGKNIQFGIAMTDINMILIHGGILLLVSLMSGLNPVQYITQNSFRKGLSSAIKAKSGLAGIRNGLVMVQFAVALIMIVGTITVYNQLNLINQGKLGENREAVIGIRTSRMGTQTQVQTFRQEIATMSGVESSTLGMHLPRQSDFGRINTKFYIPEINNEPKYWNKFDADGGFAETYDLEFIAGRDFRSNVDSSELIINEAALRSLNLTATEVLGIKLIEDSINYVYGPSTGRVIGVVKDFAYESIKESVEPVVICANNWVEGVLSVKLSEGNKPQVIEQMDAKWRKIYSDQPFEWWFLDKEFDRLYGQERRLGKLIPLFSGLAVFVALLGLFALTAFITESKVKEIGIRKVLGSSTIGIIQLLVTDFIKLILVAVAFGLPIAWYGMTIWLENFAMRVDVSVLVLLLSAVAIVALASVTVITQGMKASRSNPVDCLKYE